MKRFFKKNWDRFVSLLLIAVSVLLYFTDVPESEVKRILFWSMMALSLAMPIFSTRTAVKVAAVIFPLVACLSMLLLGTKMNIVADCTVVLVFALWFGCYLEFISSSVAVLIALLISIFSNVMLKKASQEEAMRQPTDTVFLEYVDVKSDDSIYIYVKDKGILKVSSKVAKDWDYQAGDTVKVVIYNDEIISCEGK